MSDASKWIIDTSVYTHLSRAGHLEILGRLAPAGVILVPDDVNAEIQRGREVYADILEPAEAPWVELAVLTEDEVFTQVMVKGALGGEPTQHLGECAVIACAGHRGLTALLDDRDAVVQADRLGVRSRDTLWLVIESHLTLPDVGRIDAIHMVDDLLATGMYLPVDSGESLFAWAYEEGLLPRE